jgi:hypothetical protein
VMSLHEHEAADVSAGVVESSSRRRCRDTTRVKNHSSKRIGTVACRGVP